MSEGAVLQGECKWFDSAKGFGFITPADGSADVFVHQTSIQSEGFRSLAEGEQVEYSVSVDDRGKLKANRVTGPGGVNVKGAPRQPAGGGFREGGQQRTGAAAFQNTNAGYGGQQQQYQQQQFPPQQGGY